MVYLSRIYTKTGDQGETALGDGSRVPKDHARVAAYGTVDELNAVLGLLLVHHPAGPTWPSWRTCCAASRMTCSTWAQTCAGRNRRTNRQGSGYVCVPSKRSGWKRPSTDLTSGWSRCGASFCRAAPWRPPGAIWPGPFAVGPNASRHPRPDRGDQSAGDRLSEPAFGFAVRAGARLQSATAGTTCCGCRGKQ